MTKQYAIPKQQVVQAYKLIKANAGSAGVDEQSLEDFERDLKDNMYKLWNRMSSGSYFPPPVKAVPIPKKSGKGTRVLGIPTVEDRIAQMVVKLTFEPQVEPYFLPDSYGYRPNRSALDAVGITRQRCWNHAWVLEFDIKGLFDNIPHKLLLKAVRKHTKEKWVLLYIQRWLTAPMQMQDGSLQERKTGTPQGGVISPVLSNLFLHYVFDKWMQREQSQLTWCRYADDGLVHCNTKDQAQALLEALSKRFKECGLELHPDKTRIVYCKNSKRKQKQSCIEFDFLGYTFKPRLVKNSKEGSYFVSFTPAASKSAKKAMRDKTRSCKWHQRSELSLEDIAHSYNPVLQGWLSYYGRYFPSELEEVWWHFNRVLIKWLMRKYKKLKGSKKRAVQYLSQIAEKHPNLFAHWRRGMTGSFV